MARLFSQLAFSIDIENAGMQKVMGEAMEFSDADRAMVAQHPEVLDVWLKDVTTFDGQPGLPAAKSALGL